MSEKPSEGLGRGGRGAFILAALSKQPRRPGQNSPVSPIEDKPKPAEERLTLGRGAFLSTISQQSTQSFSRGRALPVIEGSEPKTFVGRGRALGLALSSISNETLKDVQKIEPISAETAVRAPPLPESLCTKVEELSIGKYSGTSGADLKLEVNYVRLNVLGNVGISEYHVSFNPSVDSKSMKFRLISQEAVKNVIGNVKTFDGSKLYLPRKLSAETNVTVRLLTDNTPVNVCIKYIKVCQPRDCLHLYNLLFKRVMHILKMTRVGRNYFDPKGNIAIPQHKLEVWPGYVTAVQEYEGGVMLNCDCSFRVLRTVTASTIMQEISRQGSNIPENVSKALIGNIVLTRYNNKTYRVDDIAFNMTPKSTFTMRDGSEISFIDYYKRSYDLNIQHVDLPLLISKGKRKAMGEGDDENERMICLMPEFCFLTGLTDEMRNDFKVMKDIATCTRVTPERRQLALQKFIDNVSKTPEARDCFKNWNLELDMLPVSLEGRHLKPETLGFGRNVKVPLSLDADWGRQMTSNHVLVPVHFEKWVVVFTKRDSPRVMDFTKMLRSVCPPMGIQVKEPIRIEIHNDRTETYCEALKEAINPTVQIVVIIFPTARDDRYSAVKKLCCIEMPVPSQVINSKTIGNPQKLRSVVQKVALQMNCKLGGELWSIHIPIKNLMICGLDTYHDASRSKKSVLAFVASMNENRTRWFSMTSMQKPGQEVGDSLKMLFISALRKYFEVNHCLPDKVVLFRDGVGDGQIEFISQYEVQQLTSCYTHFSQNYSPELSVIVVQKRINTRMYAVQNERGRSVLANPPPGSVLDHSVTRKPWYDFFLVSQHVRQGTVSPTHYVVIHDTSSLKPDHMQKLTYKMTHLYYNWPGTVRVPAPCQYAHKLAYLVGQNLHRETHCDLSDRLFYL